MKMFHNHWIKNFIFLDIDLFRREHKACVEDIKEAHRKQHMVSSSFTQLTLIQHLNWPSHFIVAEDTRELWYRFCLRAVTFVVENCCQPPFTQQLIILLPLCHLSSRSPSLPVNRFNKVVCRVKSSPIFILYYVYDAWMIWFFSTVHHYLCAKQHSPLRTPPLEGLPGCPWLSLAHHSFHHLHNHHHTLYSWICPNVLHYYFIHSWKVLNPKLKPIVFCITLAIPFKSVILPL